MIKLILIPVVLIAASSWLQMKPPACEPFDCCDPKWPSCDKIL